MIYLWHFCCSNFDIHDHDADAGAVAEATIVFHAASEFLLSLSMVLIKPHNSS